MRVENVPSKVLHKNRSVDFSKMKSRPMKLFPTSKKSSYNYDLDPDKTFLGQSRGVKLNYPTHKKPKRTRDSVTGYLNNYYNNEQDKSKEPRKVLSFEKTGHQPPSLLVPQGWQLRDHLTSKSVTITRRGESSDDHRLAAYVRRKRETELQDILNTNLRLAD